MPDVWKDCKKWIASQGASLAYMSLVGGFYAGWLARDGAVEQLAEADPTGRQEESGLEEAARLAGSLYRVVKSMDNDGVGHISLAFTEKDGTRGAVIVLAPDAGNEEILAAVGAICDKQAEAAAGRAA